MNTELIAITDCSGSMSSIRAAAIAGFRAFIQEQATIPGECRVTSVVFDTTVSTQYSQRDIREVPDLDLRPSGMTALYDAIGLTLNAEGTRIQREMWADTTIVVIITDGQENSSRRFKSGDIQELVGHYEALGWKFVFLAANQDAFAAGAALGIDRNTTYNFSATNEGTKSAYADMSTTVRSLRSTGL